MTKSSLLLFGLFLILSFNSSSQCFVGNCKEGYGEKKYDSGSIYKGYWKGGQKNGFGTIVKTSGFSYSGKWKEGDYHGYGKMTYSDGRTYEGEFRYDKKHGLGTFYSSSGKVLFAGQYNENNRVAASSSLPKDIRADKYLIEAKNLMESNSYKKAIVSFNKILALNVSPPISFYFHLGKCHYKSKNYERAIDSFNKYLIGAGKNGEFYVKALEYQSYAEQKVNQEKLKQTETKLEIKNCSVCGGDGYYSKYKSCGTCGGDGSINKRCSNCDGKGFLYSQWVYCNYCGGDGNACTLSNYCKCSSCSGTGQVLNTKYCNRCGADGKIKKSCSRCDGRGKYKVKKKCYKH